MTRYHKFFLIVVFLGVTCVSNQQAVAQISLVSVGYTNIGVALDLRVSGNYAYLANGSGLRICDISDPANPISVAESPSPGTARGIAVSGNLAFLANDGGLDIYDVSTPQNPVDIAHTNMSGAYSVTVSSNYAYVANRALSVFDVSNPSIPSKVGQAPSGGWYQILLSDKYAYLSNPNSGSTLYVYDVSNPYAPTNVYTSAGAYIFGIAISGHYLFAASQAFLPASGGVTSGLLTFDISNPTNPVYRATTGVSVSAGARVVVTNGYVYLIDYSKGLLVYDASNPTNLVNVGQIKNSGTAWGVAVSGNYAYVSGTDGLHIIAVTPQLGIATLSSNTLLLSWPAPASFKLQESPDSRAVLWETLTNTPVAIGSSNQMVLPAPTNTMFYRLVSQ